MKELTDPAFLAALATLITAIGAVIKIFHVDATTKDSNVRVKDVQRTTNGAMNTLQEQVDSLRRHVALLERANQVPQSAAAPDSTPEPPHVMSP